MDVIVEQFNESLNSPMRNLKEWEVLVTQAISQHAWLANASSSELNSVRTRTPSLRVASYWYHFSIFAADFLCLALPLLHSHGNRAYVAQTVNEELGSGIPERVHSVLLLDALTQCGLDKNEILFYPTIELDAVFESLKQRLLSTKTDHEIAGFFLGFELLAEHNINHVFECLHPTACTREELRQTDYFQEHFQVEPEHIRRAITMGMSSCSGDREIKAMLDTYHHGISFWNDFWKVVHQDALEQSDFRFATQEQFSREPLLAKT